MLTSLVACREYPVNPANHAILSMLEMAHACKNHGEIVLVGGGDDFFVAHRTSGLNHRGDSMLRSFVNAVAEREERIGRKHRTGNRQLRSHRADLHGVNARHLTRSNA